MAINPLQHHFHLTADNVLQISRSVEDLRNKASLRIEDSFFRNHISHAAEGPRPGLDPADWSLIDVRTPQGVVKKVISIAGLQLAIEQFQADLDRKVMNSVFVKEAEVLRRILDKGEISEKARCEAIILAASRENITSFYQLLQIGPTSEETLGLALKDSAENGYLSMIKEICAIRPISLKSLVSALIIAIHKDRKQVTAFLLKQLEYQVDATP